MLTVYSSSEGLDHQQQPASSWTPLRPAAFSLQNSTYLSLKATCSPTQQAHVAA